MGNRDQSIKDLRKAKDLFDQGKTIGLSKDNIKYIRESLDILIKILDASEIFQNKLKLAKT